MGIRLCYKGRIERGGIGKIIVKLQKLFFMYLHALIMMLFNTSSNRWHPIFYFESPLPGPYDEQSIVRYKSKGHHTVGFDNREDALKECVSVKDRLINEMSCPDVIDETNEDLVWDGEGMPTDIQMRPKRTVTL